MAALPSQTYAMPVNAFVLVLLGVIVEFFCRALLRIRAASVIPAAQADYGRPA